ncbi:thiamine pyrophosphate-dependent enzyme [Pseudonocardia sp.]|jgi:pyruvate dehydrogenase (quinone)/pyruvate oxidase|uniref:thiamine pyrophosphate-dependent enzyme n=1 Tax=Pseudonocardia sp. TaxID=60912 RepID=UPI0031FCCDB8
MADESTTSDLIVERLLEWGVDICFGICGDQVNGFFEAIRTRADRFRFVHVRHEESAALAAVGHAKFTGRPAAVVTTAGPGALHLLNGLYDARMDGAPVIVITGIPHHDVLGTHMLQDVPSDRLFEQVCPFNERVMGRAHAAAMTDLAVRSALQNRTPSHLAIPLDVQSMTEDTPSPKNVPDHLSTAWSPATLTPPADLVHAAADLLNSCERVAICAGAGARGAGDVLEVIADSLGAPIVKAGLGKAVVPDDSPFTTGGMGLLGTRASQEVFEQCNGFLIVGSATPYAEFWPKPGQARTVQIDVNADRIGLRHPVEIALVGHAEPTLTALLPLVHERRDRSFLEQAQRGVLRWWDLLREQANSSGSPIRPQVVTVALSELLPDRAIVTGDAGSNTFVSHRLRLRRGMDYGFSGTLCTMGSAVPYAIGAQIAFPQRPVVAVVGDGGMAMGMGELATLAQYQLPITVVVLRNNALALEIWEQAALLGNPQYGCELSPVDFAGVARACGLEGWSVSEPGDVRAALAAALAHDGPSLVEVVVDPFEAPFGETLKPEQAQKIVQAFDKGEPAAGAMARNLLDPARRVLSPGVQAAAEDFERYAAH